MTSTVLPIDEESELDFKINVTGTSSAETPQTWLVFETEDMDMRFKGRHSDEDHGVLTYTVPRLYGKVKDGTYSAHLEVMVEGRYFKLVPFEVELKQPISVTVENVSRKQKSDLNVTVESHVRESAGPVAVRSTNRVQSTPRVELTPALKQRLVESEAVSKRSEKNERSSVKENPPKSQVQRLSAKDLRNL